MSKFAPHRRGTNNPPATANTVCQKCLGRGHYIYECKGARPYLSRPSRTELLEKPNALNKSKKEGQPSVELPEEFKTKTGVANKILEERERQRKESADSESRSHPKKRRKRSLSPSDSDSDTTTSSSESESDSDSQSSDSESNSDSSSTSSRTRSSRNSFRSTGRKRRRSP